MQQRSASRSTPSLSLLGAAAVESGGDPGVAFVVAFVVVAGTAIPSRPLAGPLLALAVGCQDADSAAKQLRPQRQGGWCCDEKLEDIIIIIGV